MKKIIGILGVAVFALTLFLNVSLIIGEIGGDNSSMLVKVYANEKEGDGWGNFFSGQGWTQDEREIQEQCYSYENWYGGLSYGGASATAGETRALAAGRTDIRCAYGEVNCSSVGC